MSKVKTKNTKTKQGMEQIGYEEKELPTVIENNDRGKYQISPLKANYAHDILSAHLCLTAPDRDMVLLPMTGLEFQEDSCELFHGLNPKNTSEKLIATLAVSLFNASLSSIADGTRKNTPPNIRDINLRHGIKAATVVADLLEKLHERQSGNEKTVRVGKVNVEPGGQAIVGNVQAAHDEAGPKASKRKSGLLDVVDV
jgi:hypothetical protein